MSEVRKAPIYVKAVLDIFCLPMKVNNTGRSQALQGAIDCLVTDGMVKSVGDEYELTDDGRGYVEMILRTPYPTWKLVDPRNGEVLQ